MPAFDAKADTAALAAALAAADKFAFGDVSVDSWDTMLAQDLLEALLRVATTTGDIGLARAAAGVLSLAQGAAGGTLRSIPLTPPQITANQNNYTLAPARFYRLSADAARTITGFACSQVDGQECEFWNVTAGVITIAHGSASSTDVNRFLNSTAADFTLAQHDMVRLRYDGTISRWRVSKG